MSTSIKTYSLSTPTIGTALALGMSSIKEGR